MVLAPQVVSTNCPKSHAFGNIGWWACMGWGSNWQGSVLHDGFTAGFSCPALSQIAVVHRNRYNVCKTCLVCGWPVNNLSTAPTSQLHCLNSS